jgi:thiol:disulfide interchange protein
VKPGFEAKSVVAKMKELNVLALVADYSSTPNELTSEMEKFGRSAVPVVLVYPKDSSKPGFVLPDPLPFVSYAPVILAALEKL